MMPIDPKSKLFNTNGTEGMLDVILSCTLIFILLTCLIQAGSSQAQEKLLPSVNLTKSEKGKLGSSAVKRNTITMKKEKNTLVLFYNSRQVSVGELNSLLKKSKGIGHIALRRDREIPCEWEDKVIILCRDAGISRVSIVIESGQQQKK